MNASVARLALEPQTLASTTGVAHDVLAAAQARLGFVPQMYANMANAPGLLHTYTTGYEHFRQASGFTPVEQEVVFLTISRFHRCAYCMAAHSRIADQASKVPAAVLRALRAGTTIPDTQLAALSAFTHAMVESRGEPSPEQVQAFRAAGYTDRHVLEIILAIAVKTLSNYSNHVLHTPLDPAFRAYAWSA